MRRSGGDRRAKGSDNEIQHVHHIITVNIRSSLNLSISEFYQRHEDRGTCVTYFMPSLSVISLDPEDRDPVHEAAPTSKFFLSQG